jgi:DNA-binding response OmpR family regulator
VIIWGYETFGSRNFVEAHVSRLRAKLKAAGAGNVVSTVRGVGYIVR